MTAPIPTCCQTAAEADALRWAGGGYLVALYRDGSGVVETKASFCPFCGEHLPPKAHPMRSFCSDEVLAPYDEADARAKKAEAANVWLRGVAQDIKELHDRKQFARVARLAEKISGEEGSPMWEGTR